MFSETATGGTLQPYEVPGPRCWMLTSGKSNSAVESEEYKFQDGLTAPTLFQLESVEKECTLSFRVFVFSSPTFWSLTF